MWLMLLAGLSVAQDTAVPRELPIDVERFRPATDPYGYAVTDSSTTLANLQVGFGLWGNYSQDSLVLMWDGSRVIGPGPNFPDAILDHRTVMDFQLGFGLGDLFSLTADAPVIVWQQGFEPASNASPVPNADLESSGLGDLRITPKFVLVDIHEGYPVGVAVLVRATVPTGSTRSFLGEGGFTGEPAFVLEVADGSIHDREYTVRGAVNVGALIKEPDTFRGIELGNAFTYRGALAAHPIFALEVGGDITGSVSGARVAQVPLEIQPWLKVHPMDIVTVTAGAGFGLNPGLGSPDFRVFFGGSIQPSFDPLSLDRDSDGVPNKFDACINVPEDMDGFEDDDGCPDDDNDKDGILDVSDQCPNRPEDVDDFEDADGCPDEDNDRDQILDIHDSCPYDPEDYDGWQDLDGCPDPDNDGDGIPDAQDLCANAAETFNGFTDDDGCPDEKPFVDTDGDGYVDSEDGCPAEPEDFDTFQDEDGCPDPDNDYDGVLDEADSCPFEPETLNGYLDEDGCPDVAPARVVVGKRKIKITDQIFFEYNRAGIQPLSFELLDEIAAVILDNPLLTSIRVEGHTDADGPEGYNLKLSQRRAEEVVGYLVKAGVPQDRLEPVGYGESQPVDTNKTPEGKANNRRVEFVILERSE
ncbi:MAG: outer membrane protein OmpA-like peptidoglycan-associated protein [Myxococcota bacterium]|jgi:outer membrane protein OmpA-like peptidoglycan-associated protein